MLPSSLVQLAQEGKQAVTDSQPLRDFFYSPDEREMGFKKEASFPPWRKTSLQWFSEFCALKIRAMGTILEWEGKIPEEKNTLLKFFWHRKVGYLFWIFVKVWKIGTLPSRLPYCSPSNSPTNLLLPNVPPPRAKAKVGFGLAFEPVGTPLASVDKVIQLCSPNTMGTVVN